MSNRYLSMLAAIPLILLLPHHTALSQQSRIIIDGEFSDWDDLEPVYSDPLQDNQGNVVDFGGLWMGNDEHHLFLSVDLGFEIIIQETNQVRMYIDSDNDPGTGLSVNGIGAELVWNFGQRSGQFYSDGGSTVVFHNDIGLVTAPTVSSSRFEIALDRDALPNGAAPLFPSSTVEVQFIDGLEPNDLLPDKADTISYTFNDDNHPPQLTNSISKKQDDHLRILSYNVQVDGIFQESRRSAYEGILGAIYPEIIGFVEIYNYSAEETRQLIESMMPAKAGVSWYSARIDPDIVAVGQFPISESFSIGTNGAFVFDLRPAYDTELLLLVAHPPCCAGNDDARQHEIDAMMAFIRDAKGPGGLIDLEQNTPIVIVGDMNLVGDSQQLRTLLTGDIQNTIGFGPPFPPDWDSSNFSDLVPVHIGSPFSFTWYNATSSFSPGRLDFLIFSDSVMKPENGFVLFTPALAQDSLNRYDLSISDVTIASDHLPVVGDFSINISSDVAIANWDGLPTDFSLQQNFPNPARGTTTISVDLQAPAEVELSVFNSLGQLIRKLVSRSLTRGRHNFNWDGRDDLEREVAAGRYFYEIRVNGEVARLKLLLLE